MENVLLHILGIRMQLFLAILRNMEVAHKVCLRCVTPGKDPVTASLNVRKGNMKRMQNNYKTHYINKYDVCI